MVYIGTSGWQYRDWRGSFYPADIPQREWLEYYCRHFSTLELNNSFYRLPTAAAFAGWRARTPDGFVMAVKMSRFLTHLKKLGEPEEPVERFLHRASELGPRLGPVLIQLPPRFPAVPERLDETLGLFPRSVRVAVEFRDPSWFSDEVRRAARSLSGRRPAGASFASTRAAPGRLPATARTRSGPGSSGFQSSSIPGTTSSSTSTTTITPARSVTRGCSSVSVAKRG